MNANEKFIAAKAHVDEAAIAPLPNSRKVYVEGSRPDIRVPMREISQADTPTAFGGEKNPPIFVYDTSGLYTDPSAKIDICSSAPPENVLTMPKMVWALSRKKLATRSGSMPGTGMWVPIR